GAVRLARCERCGRLAVTSPHASLKRCHSCRHERLLHPLHSLHHVPESGGPSTVGTDLGGTERAESYEGTAASPEASGTQGGQVEEDGSARRPRHLVQSAHRGKVHVRT